MSNDNGPFSQKYICSRFFFFLVNEPSDISHYLREKKSKGTFLLFLFCFVLFWFFFAGK